MINYYILKNEEKIGPFTKQQVIVEKTLKLTPFRRSKLTPLRRSKLTP